MGELRIRNVDGDVKAMLQAEAQSKGLTMEAFLKQALTDLAFRERRKYAQKIRRHLDAMEAKFGILPSSVEGIRQERETRG